MVYLQFAVHLSVTVILSTFLCLSCKSHFFTNQVHHYIRISFVTASDFGNRPMFLFIFVEHFFDIWRKKPRRFVFVSANRCNEWERKKILFNIGDKMQTCIIARFQTLALNKYFDENKCVNVSRLNEEYRRKKTLWYRDLFIIRQISNFKCKASNLSVIAGLCVFLHQYEEGSIFALLILIPAYKYISIIIPKQLPIHQHV